MLCKHCIAFPLNEDMTDDGVWPPKSLIISPFTNYNFSQKLLQILHKCFWPTRNQIWSALIIISSKKVADLIFCVYLILCILCISYLLSFAYILSFVSIRPHLPLRQEEDQGRRQGWRDRLFGSYSDVCLIEVGSFFGSRFYNFLAW